MTARRSLIPLKTRAHRARLQFAHSSFSPTGQEGVVFRPISNLLQQRLDGCKERVEVGVRVVKVHGHTDRFAPSIMCDARVCQYARCGGYITDGDESCGSALTSLSV